MATLARDPDAQQRPERDDAQPARQLDPTTTHADPAAAEHGPTIRRPSRAPSVGYGALQRQALDPAGHQHGEPTAQDAELAWALNSGGLLARERGQQRTRYARAQQAALGEHAADMRGRRPGEETGGSQGASVERDAPDTQRPERDARKPAVPTLQARKPTVAEPAAEPALHEPSPADAQTTTAAPAPVVKASRAATRVGARTPTTPVAEHAQVETAPVTTPDVQQDGGSRVRPHTRRDRAARHDGPAAGVESEAPTRVDACAAPSRPPRQASVETGPSLADQLGLGVEPLQPDAIALPERSGGGDALDTADEVAPYAAAEGLVERLGETMSGPVEIPPAQPAVPQRLLQAAGLDVDTAYDDFGATPRSMPEIDDDTADVDQEINARFEGAEPFRGDAEVRIGDDVDRERRERRTRRRRRARSQARRARRGQRQGREARDARGLDDKRGKRKGRGKDKGGKNLTKRIKQRKPKQVHVKFGGRAPSLKGDQAAHQKTANQTVGQMHRAGRYTRKLNRKRIAPLVPAARKRFGKLNRLSARRADRRTRRGQSRLTGTGRSDRQALAERRSSYRAEHRQDAREGQRDVRREKLTKHLRRRPRHVRRDTDKLVRPVMREAHPTPVDLSAPEAEARKYARLQRAIGRRGRSMQVGTEPFDQLASALRSPTMTQDPEQLTVEAMLPNLAAQRRKHDAAGQALGDQVPDARSLMDEAFFATTDEALGDTRSRVRQVKRRLDAPAPDSERERGGVERNATDGRREVEHEGDSLARKRRRKRRRFRREARQARREQAQALARERQGLSRDSQQANQGFGDQHAGISADHAAQHQAAQTGLQSDNSQTIGSAMTAQQLERQKHMTAIDKELQRYRQKSQQLRKRNEQQKKKVEKDYQQQQKEINKTAQKAIETEQEAAQEAITARMELGMEKATEDLNEGIEAHAEKMTDGREAVEGLENLKGMIDADDDDAAAQMAAIDDMISEAQAKAEAEAQAELTKAQTDAHQKIDWAVEDCQTRIDEMTDTVEDITRTQEEDLKQLEDDKADQLKELANDLADKQHEALDASMDRLKAKGREALQKAKKIGKDAAKAIAAANRRFLQRARRAFGRARDQIEVERKATIKVVNARRTMAKRMISHQFRVVRQQVRASGRELKRSVAASGRSAKQSITREIDKRRGAVSRYFSDAAKKYVEDAASRAGAAAFVRGLRNGKGFFGSARAAGRDPEFRRYNEMHKADLDLKTSVDAIYKERNKSFLSKAFDAVKAIGKVLIEDAKTLWNAIKDPSLSNFLKAGAVLATYVPGVGTAAKAAKFGKAVLTAAKSSRAARAMAGGVRGLGKGMGRIPGLGKLGKAGGALKMGKSYRRSLRSLAGAQLRVRAAVAAARRAGARGRKLYETSKKIVAAIARRASAPVARAGRGAAQTARRSRVGQGARRGRDRIRDGLARGRGPGKNGRGPAQAGSKRGPKKSKAPTRTRGQKARDYVRTFAKDELKTAGETFVTGLIDGKSPAEAWQSYWESSPLSSPENLAQYLAGEGIALGVGRVGKKAEEFLGLPADVRLRTVRQAVAAQGIDTLKTALGAAGNHFAAVLTGHEDWKGLEGVLQASVSATASSAIGKLKQSAFNYARTRRQLRGSPGLRSRYLDLSPDQKILAANALQDKSVDARTRWKNFHRHVRR